MTPEKSYPLGDVKFVCDGCGTIIAELNVQDQAAFDRAWDDLRADGWRCFQDGDTKIYKCRKCQKKLEGG